MLILSNLLGGSDGSIRTYRRKPGHRAQGEIPENGRRDRQRIVTASNTVDVFRAAIAGVILSASDDDPAAHPNRFQRAHFANRKFMDDDVVFNGSCFVYKCAADDGNNGRSINQ